MTRREGSFGPAVALLCALTACSPASISRIGPPLPARLAECDIEILDPGAAPERPYRDVGVVTLQNCQDFRTRPCRDWLVEAACGLGGQVAYIHADARRADSPVVEPMRFRVMVAAYASDLRPDMANDPVAKALACAAGADAGPPAKPVEQPERCME